MKILVTGAAGFIGSTLCRQLLERGDEVIGIDNLNDYYDVSLKQARLQLLESKKNFKFFKIDLSDKDELTSLFKRELPKRVVNLAAQAGVRYSITHPYAYINSNIVGFMNILENCRHEQVESLVYASSSSVYGANRTLPFSTQHNVDHPVSLYAASKKSNELMAHTYSHLYHLPTTGLRFFTVYGPWGRPDMALFIFTRNILAGKPIDVFNFGKHRRDFTYIDDIVEGIVRVLDHPAQSNKLWQGENPSPSSSSAPYKVYNIGNNDPVWLDEFISTLEIALGKTALRNNLPMQAGDVLETFADVEELTQDFDFKPKTKLKDGIEKFVNWYREYYKV